MTTDSADLILLDTSVWIDYLRKKKSVFEEVETLIEQELVCITPFIAAEILQGAKSEEEFKILQTTTEIFHCLQEQDNSWIEAARLSNQLRRGGCMVGLGDCYIATIAFQHQVTLWSFDKHFKQIEKQYKIKLYPS